MIVGKATKEPVEIETYSVIFDDDLNDGEGLTDSFHTIFNRKNAVRRAPAQENLAADYAALVTDVFKVYRSTAAVTLTLPVGLPDGSEFYVANYTQSSDFTVASAELVDGGATLLVAVNHAFVLQRQLGTWVSLVKGTNVLVDTSTDHRVRVFFNGGQDKSVYEVEATVDTNEGRRLQSELLITVKES